MAVLTPLRSSTLPGADSGRLHRSVRGWRRRSHLIGGFRRALPLLMIVVVGALIYWIVRESVGVKTAPQAGPVAIRMLNPTFRGRDDGRPFVLSAREAVRDGKNYQRIALVAPSLVLQNGPDEPPTRVSAQRGVYREDTLILTLEGDVRYADAVGWTFLTRNAVVDTRRNLITGDEGIEGRGPSGRVAADSYVIYNQGERVTFRGNVRTIMND